MSSPAEPTPTAHVNPTPENLESLAAVPDEGPIIMLNLLRYAQPDGRASYGRYSAVAFGTVRARGGSAPYIGQVISGSSSAEGEVSDWDTAILVRYPRRAAYLDMQSDPAYLGAIPDRTAGLAARLITPFHRPGGAADEPFAVPLPTDDQVLVICVDDGGAADGQGDNSGHMVLALEADVPMVVDNPWSRLTVLRFESAAEAEAGRPAEGIWLVTRP